MATIEARPIAHRYHARIQLPKPSIRIVQVILGLIWILAGALQYQPFMFSKGFVNQIIAPVAQGQPGWLGGSITWSVHVMSHHLVFYNAVFATIQVLIGVGLLFHRSVRIALLVSFAWVLAVWWFGEGLGMIPMGMASPLTGAPGAVLLYGLVGALVWPATPKTAQATTVSDKERDMRAASWTAPAGRIVWAALWFLSAALWLLPTNRGASSFHDTVQSASYGWLGVAQHSIADASSGHGLGIAIGLATVSVLIGLGVFIPATVRPTLVVGAILSLAYWAFGQSFGLITTGTATDINAGPLFVLLALRLWVDPVTLHWHRAVGPVRLAPCEAVAYPMRSRSDRIPVTR
jgi:hypothetical protein